MVKRGMHGAQHLLGFWDSSRFAYRDFHRRLRAVLPAPVRDLVARRAS